MMIKQLAADRWRAVVIAPTDGGNGIYAPYLIRRLGSRYFFCGTDF